MSSFRFFQRINGRLDHIDSKTVQYAINKTSLKCHSFAQLRLDYVDAAQALLGVPGTEKFGNQEAIQERIDRNRSSANLRNSARTTPIKRKKPENPTELWMNLLLNNLGLNDIEDKWLQKTGKVL